jgi:DNA modification methylase
MPASAPTPAPTPGLQAGDWLDLAGSLAPRSVDFLYADIPFGTGRAQRTPPRAASVPGRAHGSISHAIYADPLTDPAALARWLDARLAATRHALKPTALVAIHCDWRACAHVRITLDQLFTPAAFVNHLIWSYALGGSSPRAFARKHDDILLFANAPGQHYFNPPRTPATSQRLKGRTKKMTDVLAIPAINNMAKERTGYPTQKPLALLTLLVGACSPPGGLVLDPCCGSGTTLEAARSLGRRAVGFDLSPEAVTIAGTRLAPVASAPPARPKSPRAR